MGTNYYAIPKSNIDSATDVIDCVDYDGISVTKLHDIIKPIHIGKSSMGWKFIFDHQKWEYFSKTRASVKRFLSTCKIVNEYDCQITHQEFWLLVNSKETGIDNKEYYTNWEKYHDNGLQQGCVSDDFGEEYHDALRFSTSIDFC